MKKTNNGKIPAAMSGDGTLSAEAFRAGLQSMVAGNSKRGMDGELMGIYDGLNDDALRYAGKLERYLAPRDVKECQEAARYWAGKNQLLMTLLSLKRSMWNYGFAVRPVSGTLTKKEQEAWKKWRREKGRAVARMTLELWEDLLAMDSCVAFWRSRVAGADGTRKGDGKALVFQPERCRYIDAMGREKLFVTLGYTQKDLQDAGMSAEEVKRYSKGEFEPDETKGEYFRVLTRGRRGKGFAEPRMRTVFEACTTEEGLQYADRNWSLFAQTVIRFWKIGHEIRNGPYAGQPTHFYDSKKHLAALQASIKNKRGCMDLAVNFDRDVEYPFPSLDRYDAKKFEGGWRKIAQWAGAVGMLFFGGQNLEAESLQRMAKAEAEDDRSQMKLFLEEVIGESFAPPTEFEVSWGSEIFTDTRMFMELVKVLLTAGPLSQKSALKAAGFDQVEEQENKEPEWEMAQDEKKKGRVMPVYDKDHGKRPGVDGASGRPAGAKG